MKIPVKQLKELCPISEGSEQIERLIENHIGAVEGYHNIEEDYKDIIVIAEIKEKRIIQMQTN